MGLRETAFRDPRSYFQKYADLDDAEAEATARSIWRRINLVNLHENILPTRPRADLLLTKGASHRIEEVALRKLVRRAIMTALLRDSARSRCCCRWPRRRRRDAPACRGKDLTHVAGLAAARGPSAPTISSTARACCGGSTSRALASS